MNLSPFTTTFSIEIPTQLNLALRQIQLSFPFNVLYKIGLICFGGEFFLPFPPTSFTFSLLLFFFRCKLGQANLHHVLVEIMKSIS